MKGKIAASLFVAVLACWLAPAAAANTSAGPAKPMSASAARREAMKPIKDDPTLPRVLLIGDSIAMGYTLPLREMLAGRANVHYPIENCHTSGQILERLDVYLGDQPWDVIQFNCGIHDLTLRNEAGRAIKAGESGKPWVPLDEYRANLGTLVSRLRQTGAALIWCASTPLTNTFPHRLVPDIARYNAVAKEVMQAHGLPITDLYELVTRRGPVKWEDGAHFTIEGTRELARDVLPAIETALAQRASARNAQSPTVLNNPATTSPIAAGVSMKELRKAAANRRRRIIFNNDGGEPSVQMKSPSAKELLDLRTTVLAGTQVDSIFYCSRSSGFGLFTHFTKVGQVFTTLEGRYSVNQMPALLKAGIDPLKVMVDFSKQHGMEIFWSMRMNDTHDGGLSGYGPIIFRTNTLKQTHPEYLMGTPDKRPKHGAWSAVNYGLPEIRELAFRYFEEVCRNYDVDGVELDFFRHPVFFKSVARGQPATDAERAAMTGLMRRIRAMADEVGRSRGRPILIAMRVPDSVDYCRAIGLDLDTWLAGDLLDLLVVSGYFQLNDWDYSVALARKHGVKIYPSLDESRVSDATARQLRTTPLAYRARAANIWGAGADGVYMYNAHGPESSIWRELGEPAVLAGLDKDYFSSIRGAGNAAGGNPPYAPYQKTETLNPGNPKSVAPGKAVTARLNVGEDLAKSSGVRLKLRLRFEPASASELMGVEFNGQPLALLRADGQWLEYALAAKQIKRGSNEVKATLAANAPKAAKWMDVLLEVRH